MNKICNPDSWFTIRVRVRLIHFFHFDRLPNKATLAIVIMPGDIRIQRFKLSRTCTIWQLTTAITALKCAYSLVIFDAEWRLFNWLSFWMIILCNDFLFVKKLLSMCYNLFCTFGSNLFFFLKFFPLSIREIVKLIVCIHKIITNYLIMIKSQS